MFTDENGSSICYQIDMLSMLTDENGSSICYQIDMEVLLDRYEFNSNDG